MSEMSEEEQRVAMDLQNQMLQGHQTMARLEGQESALMRKKTRLELTISELSPLPEDTRLYKSVGKAYFLSSKPTLIKDAQDSSQSIDLEIKTCRTQKAVVEKKVKETESEFKELIKQMTQRHDNERASAKATKAIEGMRV